MSAVLEPKMQSPANVADMSAKLAFSKKLQAVTNRVHSTNNIDEIILDVSRDICQLFEADRMTVYIMSEDGSSIVSKVKTGLNSFKDIKLPISESSLAGFAALNKRHMNIKDVYDDAELKQYSPNLTFLKAVDQRTGYRSKQMLIAPILGGDTGNELMGVIQLINSLSGQPFTQLHDEGAVELSKTLAIAFRVRQSVPGSVQSKFEYLVVDNVIAAGELDLASKAARRKNKTVEDILVDEFQVKPAAIGAALSKFFGVEYEPYKPDRIKPPDLLKNIKRDYAEGNHWIPLEDGKQGVVVMSTDPERVRNSRMVENVFPRSRVVFKVTTERDFRQTLDQLFGAEGVGSMGSESIGDLLSGLDDDDELTAGADDVSAAADNELVKLVNKIIVDAYQQGASDIHVEPTPGKGKVGVRFRKDGTLTNYIEVPAAYRSPLITRLKIMCDLDISEKRKPQDGKIKFKKFGPLDIELRVATIPTAGGIEDVVMRILAAGEPIPLDKLGILPQNLERLKSCISKPYGIFFVCGPTGSGKTTTLHSVLGSLNTVDTKIWTAEDPVEITQKGLRQCQVNPKAGFTFATAMKAFLRADPDIIMVGEMRDKDTTSIGIEASLTGHLVFATLHTNSAPESIIRLLDMGMDPFNFADALLGVLAQRLAKRLCKCKKPYTPDQAEVKHFISEYSQELLNTPEFKADANASYKKVFERLQRDYGFGKPEFHLYKAVGCDACGGTGYKGRVGLHELLVGTDGIKKMIQEHSRVAEILALSLQEGMLTLKMDGMEKVLLGITDMAQVRAVCIK
ncbi:MAG TPA: GspE/PulE family protein [Usitatibacter sp.]|jgi:type II secretory ATPase GspE/PulE/Tfp pilus assembly ATPase PilB-like protein|nr:GspE/PulE family protein [Usitatibacter sp.]